MQAIKQLTKHFKAVHFGGNWASSNVKEHLEGLTWQQATTQIADFNSIATLTFHINYYVSAVAKVLAGGALVAKDAYSFDHPPITCQADWAQMVAKTLADAETFANLLAKLPEERLWEDFTDPKYGNYYANIHGIIEHTHYHLGQLVLIKKMVLAKANQEK